MNQHLSAKQPASPSLPQLFTPLALRGVTARNRIVVSPMSQYLAVDGEPGDWHLVHLGKFAMGGAGIVFVEETSVEASARKTYCCPGIYTDGQARAWRRITDFLRGQGALSAIQLGCVSSRHQSMRSGACVLSWMLSSQTKPLGTELA